MNSCRIESELRKTEGEFRTDKARKQLGSAYRAKRDSSLDTKPEITIDFLIQIFRSSEQVLSEGNSELDQLDRLQNLRIQLKKLQKFDSFVNIVHAHPNGNPLFVNAVESLYHKLNVDLITNPNSTETSNEGRIVKLSNTVFSLKTEIRDLLKRLFPKVRSSFWILTMQWLSNVGSSFMYSVSHELFFL